MARLGLSESEKQEKRETLKSAIRRESRLARKRITIADFELLKIIGKGAFGQVRLVKRRDTGEVLAMKTMIKANMLLKNQVTHVRAERNILAMNSDTFQPSTGDGAAEIQGQGDPLGRWLVQLNTSFQDLHNLYLVMEYLPGGDLMGMLIEKDTFSEEATRFYAAEAILAIEAVHALGYIHRDIKPDNFLLDGRGHIKLTDLGLCKKVDSGMLPGMEQGHFGQAANVSSQSGSKSEVPINAPSSRGSRHNRNLAQSTVGTPNYISPEVITQTGYGMECDWWSLGVILFECLCGHPPFGTVEDPMLVCRNIVNWRTTLGFPEEAKENLSESCVSFVKGLICNAEERLGYNAGAVELKQHAWFQEKGPIEFDRIRELEAPFVPEFSSEVEEIQEKLRSLSSDSEEFKKLIKRITSKFDEFDDEPLPGMMEGQLGMSRGPDPKFLGFTYRPNRHMTSKEVLTSSSASTQSPIPRSNLVVTRSVIED